MKPVALVISAVLLAACGGRTGSASAPAPTVQQTPSASEDGIPQIFQGLVQVTPDRSLSARCYGEGSPTILLEAGGSANLNDWPIDFINGLAAETTVCLYSRAGGNGSTPVEGMPTREQIVSDAFTLLDTLDSEHGVSGPYLLVGWSLGGSVVLAEALEHPEQVVGMVILDTGFPTDYLKNCRAAGRPEAECRAEYNADEEAKSMEKDIVDRLVPLPDLPVSIVNAMLDPDCRVETGETSVSVELSGIIVTAPDCESLMELIADMNLEDWRQLGTQVTQTRVDATHNGLPSEARPQITEIILDMLAAS